MKKKMLIIFLIIGLVVMFDLAKAAPIPYNWGVDHTAIFTTDSAISAWDSSQGRYVIMESIYDSADTDTRPSTYHDPPAQTSLSESYSYEYYGIIREWSGESNAFNDQNGINVYSKVSTNPFVKASDYTRSDTCGLQHGYFYIDSADKFLKVDFILNLSGEDSPGNRNYAWVEFNWYLRDYGTELDFEFTTIVDAYRDWDFYSINKSTHEEHWLIPLEEGHWYFLYAYTGETLIAYRNDLVEGEMKLSLEIVPIPTAGILLFSGVLGLIGIRRKVFKT
ncbi:MAG: hypothetical protein MW689_001428 [Thermodesulfobacteria bacterium]|nr:hypothetical protein [Thermodesulfobacteriota bacterium]MCU4137857.1 hypothetical protein [Thermodesulfobacteriota bacterium]